MVFGTVTKLIQSNQNVTIGSKNVDWVRSFISGLNRCIVSFSAHIGALKQPPHGFRHSNETDPIEQKHQYWVQKSGWGAFVHFWTESVLYFISGPNRCIKWNPDMVFGTATKLTKTNQNFTIGSKNVDWVRSFVSILNRCIVSFLARIGALKQPRHGFRHSNETDPIEP